jgi:hypothetical protein
MQKMRSGKLVLPALALQLCTAAAAAAVLGESAIMRLRPRISRELPWVLP